MKLLFCVILLPLLLFLEETKLQNSDISVIRHTLVGNGFITHCTEKTIDVEGGIVEYFTVFLKKRGRHKLFEGAVNLYQKIVPLGTNYLLSVEQYTTPDRFDIILIIENVTLIKAGLFFCEVKLKADPMRTYSGTMAHLYAHENGENNPCKDNWVYWLPGHTCIRANLDSMNWYEAREFCKFHHDADLVRVDSRAFDDFLSSISGLDSPFWIGLRSEDGTNSYHWLDDKSATPQHEYWAIDFPKEIAGNNCVSKGGHNDEAWRNVPCGSESGVICQRTIEKKSVWRAPPLWKSVLMAAFMLCVLTGLCCCYLRITPGRNAVATLLHFVGRKDLAPERDAVIIILYDSELNELVKTL